MPEDFYASAYKGSKQFSQQNIKTANATGFVAAADDYAERGIDLNEQLVQNKPATFFMKVTSNAMTGAGIYEGDVVIVDRSLTATSGKVVIAIIDGELLIRRLEKKMNNMWLIPESPGIATIEAGEYSDTKIWGVVTYVIHRP